MAAISNQMVLSVFLIWEIRFLNWRTSLLLRGSGPTGEEKEEVLCMFGIWEYVFGFDLEDVSSVFLILVCFGFWFLSWF